ncbi:MAG: helix-turn-helix domain-containing protein [Oscillospiraceae bacterium]|nr:helix-turn-helix domain-containing protein [Oscillospiraceae bacterium]
MNNTLLGKKLKEARLAKKMTQTDVVGGYITRNMLSQIESGCAFPSIRTLEYLSGVLEIPMSELVSESETIMSATSSLAMSPNMAQTLLDDLVKAKQGLLSGDFEVTIQLLSPYLKEDCAIYDESAALVCRARTALAKKYALEGDAAAAKRERKAAAEWKSKGVYSADWKKDDALRV